MEDLAERFAEVWEQGPETLEGLLAPEPSVIETVRGLLSQQLATASKDLRRSYVAFAADLCCSSATSALSTTLDEALQDRDEEVALLCLDALLRLGDSQLWYAFTGGLRVDKTGTPIKPWMHVFEPTSHSAAVHAVLERLSAVQGACPSAFECCLGGLGRLSDLQTEAATTLAALEDLSPTLAARVLATRARLGDAGVAERAGPLLEHRPVDLDAFDEALSVVEELEPRLCVGRIGQALAAFLNEPLGAPELTRRCLSLIAKLPELPSDAALWERLLGEAPPRVRSHAVEVLDPHGVVRLEHLDAALQETDADLTRTALWRLSKRPVDSATLVVWRREVAGPRGEAAVKRLADLWRGAGALQAEVEAAIRAQLDPARPDAARAAIAAWRTLQAPMAWTPDLERLTDGHTEDVARVLGTVMGMDHRGPEVYTDEPTRSLWARLARHPRADVRVRIVESWDSLARREQVSAEDLARTVLEAWVRESDQVEAHAPPPVEMPPVQTTASEMMWEPHPSPAQLPISPSLWDPKTGNKAAVHSEQRYVLRALLRALRVLWEQRGPDGSGQLTLETLQGLLPQPDCLLACVDELHLNRPIERRTLVEVLST